MMYCTECGGAVYVDQEDRTHCIRCEYLEERCPACQGKGYQEIRARVKTCEWCGGIGLRAEGGAV